MEYSQVGHFGWILAPILILDLEKQNVYLEHGKSHVLGHIFYKSFFYSFRVPIPFGGGADTSGLRNLTRQ